MGMLADLKEKVESLEAAHGMRGKDRQQGLLVMPIDNRDIKVEAATGGLMSPREGYGVGSLATKGVMKALQKRAKAKKEYDTRTHPEGLKEDDYIDDRMPPSDTLEDYIDKPVDPIKDSLSRGARQEVVNEMKIVEGMNAQDIHDTIEEEVFDALWMDDTVPYEERWGFMRELLLDTKTKTQPLYTEEVEEAVRSGIRRFLYEVDADYSDAVSNRQVDDIEEIEDSLFKDLITEITKGDRGKKQEGGSLMSSRKEYGLGSLVSKALEKFFTPSEKTSSSELSNPTSEMVIIGNPSPDSPSFFSNEKGQVTPEFMERATNNFKQLKRDGFEISKNINREGYEDYFAKRITPNSAEIYPIDTETWTIKPSNYRMSNMADRAPQIESDGGYIKKQEGGEMAMPPEYTEDIPVDTYPNMTPEEEAMPIASDEQMQEDYVDYVTAEVLTTSEQDYLNAALDNDPQLESILDKVVTYATEFTGEGEVEGPGTGISDSIPARLSDGEFVITKKATDQIGADNLQTMMDEAERAADGGMMQKYALGGAVDNTMLGGAVKDTTPLMDEKTGMYGTTRQDDEMKKQMMYANRMPSIIGR